MPQHPDPIIRSLRSLASPKNKYSPRIRLEATKLLLEYTRAQTVAGVAKTKTMQGLTSILGEQLGNLVQRTASGDELTKAV